MTIQSPVEELIERLAIEGGTPVRSHPLAWEAPGGNGIGAAELELVSRDEGAEPLPILWPRPSAHG